MIIKTTSSQSRQHTVNKLYYVDLLITKVAYGAKIVWQTITSCFGSGNWKEDSNWVDSEIWKD